MFFLEIDKIFRRRDCTIETLIQIDPTNIIQAVESNFRFIRIYQWIHGIGFISPTGSFFQNFLVLCVSVFLALFFNGWTLYEIFNDFYNATELNRQLVIETTVNTSDIIQRILFYRRRREIDSVVRRLCAVYASLEPRKNLNFKLKSAVILLFSDSIFIVICVLLYKSLVSAPDFEDYKNEFHYAIIPPPHAWIIKFARFVIVDWGAATSSVTAYFCSVCYVLKTILTELHQKLEDEIDCDVETLFRTYNEITHIITKINDIFEKLFIFGFISISVLIFIDFLSVLSKGLDNIDGITTLLLMCYPFSWFVAICIFSSSVAAAVSRLRNVVHCHRDIATSFKLKVNEGFWGFTILDSITLNKSSVLSALGALVTYGVIVATFNFSAVTET